MQWHIPRSLVLHQREGAIVSFSGRLSISGFARTMMAGDPIAMEQEDMYLKALQSAATYEIHAGTLTIKGSSGDMVVQYEAIED